VQHEIDLKDATERVTAEGREQLAIWRSQVQTIQRLRDAASQVGNSLLQSVSDADYSLETSKQALAAMLSGGKQAAAYATFLADAIDQGATNAEGLAAAYAQIVTEQQQIDKLMQIATEAATPMWERLVDAGLSAADSIGSAIGDAVSQGLDHRHDRRRQDLAFVPVEHGEPVRQFRAAVDR
jgi:hypothetical protein